MQVCVCAGVRVCRCVSVCVVCVKLQYFYAVPEEKQYIMQLLISLDSTYMHTHSLSLS